VSLKLYKRASAEAGVVGNALQEHKKEVSTRRTAPAAQLVQTLVASDLAMRPTSAALTRLNALHRKNRIRQLGKRSVFDNLRVRSSKFSTSASRPQQLIRRLVAHREQIANSIPTRLVASVDTFAPVTSLWFQEPVTGVVKTAAAKEQDELAAIAEKEERYKFTAQYAESVTSFIPELMNFMLSRKIENKRINYQTAQHMVRNIY